MLHRTISILIIGTLWHDWRAYRSIQSARLVAWSRVQVQGFNLLLLIIGHWLHETVLLEHVVLNRIPIRVHL